MRLSEHCGQGDTVPAHRPAICKWDSKIFIITGAFFFSSCAMGHMHTSFVSV